MKHTNRTMEMDKNCGRRNEGRRFQLQVTADSFKGLVCMKPKLQMRQKDVKRMKRILSYARKRKLSENSCVEKFHHHDSSSDPDAEVINIRDEKLPAPLPGDDGNSSREIEDFCALLAGGDGDKPDKSSEELESLMEEFFR